METYTADRIREVLGEEALAKLITPTKWVPRHVEGAWASEYAVPGVVVQDVFGHRARFESTDDRPFPHWECDGRNPKVDHMENFTVLEWPGAEIRDIIPDGPQPIEPEKTRPYIGQIITTAEELKALPENTRIGGDEAIAFRKKKGGKWISPLNGPICDATVLEEVGGTAVITALLADYE
ncbi:hypothetical protein [Corynebacterium heidelbergense]|uniref:Uncharacterized protein n=2 Tax=Corynebacterium heidelbergense TaxID=2055947 RepID=A0A364VE19_9CORY|nr:hypothetical protein [Corynebacterium heidelbergense]RAV34887.1 hypothetical protein CWC39_00680 [Corynebacterium heidelbergense]WCZ36023.1 hypothetical protein CHEID_02280 [Corynebacterium heidelbergense]